MSSVRSRSKNKEKKPSLIFSADWHIRPDKPECRTDDFIETQFYKLEQVASLSNQYEVPVIVAGDVGDQPVRGWPIWFIQRVIHTFKNSFNHEIIVTAGQHDLPNHNLELINQSGLGVLNSAGAVKCITDGWIELNGIAIALFPYGVNIFDIDALKYYDRKIAVMHQMVIEDDKLWPDQKAKTARQYLRHFNYDCIVAGDNHQSFVDEYKQKILVNCGSLTRQRSNYIDHKPCVWLYYAEDNTVEPYYLKIDRDAVSQEIRIKEVEHDERIEKWIECMNTSYEVGLKFDDNLKTHFESNEYSKTVQNKAWSIYESAGRQTT